LYLFLTDFYRYFFNLKGQKVRTLINGFDEPRKHQLVWNGTDNQGYKVSCGFYFTRLGTLEKVSVKKIVLIK